jgi:uroporphyrinogen decarboxylase
MLPRERVFAALEHREPDRVPWGEHSINYNVYEDILGRKSFVQGQIWETQAFWEGRRDEVVAGYKRDKIDLCRALDMDIIHPNWVPPKNYAPKPYEKIGPEAYKDEQGNIWHVSATTHALMPYQMNTDHYVEPTVQSVQEKIDAFNWDEPIADDSCWDLTRHVVKEMKKTHFVMQLCGDLEWPRFGRTEEESWMNLVLKPDVCMKLAELRQMELVREVRTYAKLGVDGVMPCGDLGSSHALMASPEIYRRMCYPVHKAHVDEAHRLGLKVLKHCCGNIMPVIHEIAGLYDAYEAIQGTAGMDIGKLKPLVGDKITLWGGIWHEHIILGTPEDIRNDARYAFSTAAPGGGFIMGSTHSIAVGAKKENVLEMKRVRDQWGTYPIDPSKFV